ncbi:MAG: hypothetical protein GC179_17080 [Anaerolineaceae bacterium]|nr:hypothetical protein [Anaerolineaceae bacterium]
MLNPNPYMMLSGALGFSAADLNANRLGVLTPYQRQLLSGQRSRTLAWSAGLILFLVLLGFVFEMQWLLIAFFAACFITIMLATWQRYQEDLDVPVEMVAGKLAFQPLPLGRYAAVINGQSFRLSKQLKSAFNESLHYRLYYTPGTRTILSAEIV